MSMGDRIAVMNAGHIQQIDPPEEIYHDPNSLFVADFVGSPAINFFEMTFEGGRIVGEGIEYDLPAEIVDELRAALPGDQVILGVRPEDLNITEPGRGLADLKVEVIEPMGDTKIVYVDMGDKRFNVVVESTREVSAGDTIGLDVAWPNVHFFSPEGPKILTWRQVVPDAGTGADRGGAVADGSGRPREEET